MDGALIARKYLLLDSQHQWNDASLYYETTVPIRGRRVDKRSASTISSFPVDALRLSTLRGHVFHLLG